MTSLGMGEKAQRDKHRITMLTHQCWFVHVIVGEASCSAGGEMNFRFQIMRRVSPFRCFGTHPLWTDGNNSSWINSEEISSLSVVIGLRNEAGRPELGDPFSSLNGGKGKRTEVEVTELESRKQWDSPVVSGMLLKSLATSRNAFFPSRYSVVLMSPFYDPFQCKGVLWHCVLHRLNAV